jgi:hypothetical protein
MNYPRSYRESNSDSDFFEKLILPVLDGAALGSAFGAGYYDLWTCFAFSASFTIGAACYGFLARSTALLVWF